MPEYIPEKEEKFLTEQEVRAIVSSSMENVGMFGGGAGNETFQFDRRKGIWLGAKNFDDAPFKVDMDGLATAVGLNVEWINIGNTDGKKPADNADVTGDNAQAYAWLTGSKPPTNADNTAANAQSISWLSDSGNFGNMAWEDLVQYSKLGSTVIVGGYIKTSLLTASNIVTGTLTGIIIRTSGSGQRVQLQSDEVQIYSSSGSSGVLKGLYTGGVNYANFTGPVQVNGEIVAGSNVRPSATGVKNLGSNSFFWNDAFVRTLKFDYEQTDYISQINNSGTSYVRIQFNASGGDIRFGRKITPYTTGAYSLGSSTYKWNNLYLANKIYWGGTSYYLHHDGNVFKINDDLQPIADGSKRLGYTNMAWYAVHSDNYLGCNLPTSNSGIEVFKRIKKPKIESGKAKGFHAGKRHYFNIDEFPDEMKMTDKDSGKKDIELTRTIGVTVSAVRELVETIETLTKRILILETNKQL